ncbi:hypothetical protein FOPG_12032 [Fusarium oxysporum f. sp. conglutinans race 2 54008]|uniref:Uncharacterized protein n=1 Tax=Fusarium oxysporum f. sp. conglutinans race 2 54008 TaxID=1089457 RepID=X0H8M2_FUSOX|nr:hypothetical protein FOPG_12032 [Fusarium oxysporum f. sp. conglutinans race 2 54008]
MADVSATFVSKYEHSEEVSRSPQLVLQYHQVVPLRIPS